MGGRDDGLTLIGLAEKLEAMTERLGGLERENAGRLEALERKNERLEALGRENASLREEVAALRGSGAHGTVEESAPELEGRVSRRSLLTKAGAAAVAAAAAGTLLNPREAKADTFDSVISNSSVFATTFVSAGRGVFALHNSDSNTAVYGRNRGFGPGVRGEKQAGDGRGPAVEGTNKSTGGPGVNGEGGFNGTGVQGHGVIGVRGSSSVQGQAGVYGEHDTFGPGVVGDGHGEQYAGVLGRNSLGTGVWGQSRRPGFSGVTGQHLGLGYGVIGLGNGSGNAGVLARGAGGAAGVRGEADGTGDTPGVHGVNTGVGHGVLGETTSLNKAGVFGRSTQGWGGRFEGGKAQLLLVPRGSVGPPATGAHAKGELSMDSNATLFVCVAGGGPGTWRRVATAAT